jgi:hypothetical protein
VVATVNVAAAQRAAPAAARIVGTVTDATRGAPLANVGVGAVGGTVGARTGADGRYAVNGVAPGRYVIRAPTISNVRVRTRGGLSLDDAARQPAAPVNTLLRPPDGAGPREPYAVPEREKMYPEPSMFGVLPAHRFHVRHARGLVLDGVEVRAERPDGRPALVLDDVQDVTLLGVDARTPARVPAVVLRDVLGFRALHSTAAPDTTVARAARLDLSPTPTP